MFTVLGREVEEVVDKEEGDERVEELLSPKVIIVFGWEVAGKEEEGFFSPEIIMVLGREEEVSFSPESFVEFGREVAGEEVEGEKEEEDVEGGGEGGGEGEGWERVRFFSLELAPLICFSLFSTLCWMFLSDPTSFV